MSPATRIARRFAKLKGEGRAGLATFLTAGDPDAATFARILQSLPAAGADFIEIGMPFTDPMADGPAIQASSLRALHQGQCMRRTLAMVADFRRRDDETPIVLMGYFNPIYVYGIPRFVVDARDAGADALIVVDLPPEEAEELWEPARSAGLNLIFLTAPTTDEGRLAAILRYAGGFLYHVSISGITGTASAELADVAAAVARIRKATALPIAVGFGIRTAVQAAAMARIADLVVVGSALVGRIADNLEPGGAAGNGVVAAVTDLVADLAEGVRTASGREPIGEPVA